MSTIRSNPVPRPKSEQDLQTTSLNVPSAWLDEAEGLAEKMSEAAGSPKGSLTRSHALRVALRRGLDVLAAEFGKPPPKRRS